MSKIYGVRFKRALSFALTGDKDKLLAEFDSADDWYITEVVIDLLENIGSTRGDIK